MALLAIEMIIVSLVCYAIMALFLKLTNNVESRRLIGISVIILYAISSYWVGSIGMKMINIDSRRPPDEKIPSFWSLLIFSDPELKEMRKARKKAEKEKAIADSTPMPVQEINAAKWYNTDTPVTLADNQEKVVLLGFFEYTYSVNESLIAFLKKAELKYASKGLVVTLLSRERSERLESHFGTSLEKLNVNWPVGAESSTFEDYGVSDRYYVHIIVNGVSLWRGDPMNLEENLKKIMKKRR